MNNEGSITADCRLLDSRRRTHIPQTILDAAGISGSCLLEFIAQNGCVIARPIIGFTVPNHAASGKFIKRGKG